jgi:hypothetical protein
MFRMCHPSNPVTNDYPGHFYVAVEERADRHAGRICAHAGVAAAALLAAVRPVDQ